MGQNLRWDSLPFCSFYEVVTLKCLLASQLIVVLRTLLCFLSLSCGHATEATVRLEHLNLLLLLESQWDLMLLDFRRANLEFFGRCKELLLCGSGFFVVLAGTAYLVGSDGGHFGKRGYLIEMHGRVLWSDYRAGTEVVSMVLGDELLALLRLRCDNVKGRVTDYVVFALESEHGMVVFENAFGSLEVRRSSC